MRHLTTGGGSPEAVLRTMLWVVAIVAIFAPISARLFRRAN